MPPEEFKRAKLYFDGKEIGEVGSLEVTEAMATENDEYKDFEKLLNSKGSLTFTGKILGFDKAIRLYKILEHTKKKLFNRIFGEPAGRLYLIGIGGTN